MGFGHQPKKWWLSTKVTDKTDDDFTNWFLYDMTHDNDCADVIGALRDACLDIFDEINNSDAKTPKEKMHAYFGVKDIPEEEMIDEILVEKKRRFIKTPLDLFLQLLRQSKFFWALNESKTHFSIIP